MSENFSNSLAHWYSRQLQKNSKPVLNPAWPMYWILSYPCTSSCFLFDPTVFKAYREMWAWCDLRVFVCDQRC